MVDAVERSRVTPYAFEILGSATRSVSGSSARVALVGGGSSVLITNPGTVTCYFKFGDSSVTAALTDSQAILPSTQLLFTLSNVGTQTHIAAINDGTAVTLQISTGLGI